MAHSPQRDGGSRDKILDVAEALFARRGFAGVGLREVAEAAGLGKSSLFHHFRSKAQLYLRGARARPRCASTSASRRCSRAMPRPASSSTAGSTPLIDALAEQPSTARLLLRALFEDEAFESEDWPEGQARRRARWRRSWTASCACSREGMQAGVFRTASPPHVVQTLIGATRLPLRVRRARRGAARRPAALGRGRARAQGRDEDILAPRTRAAARARPPEETHREQAHAGASQALRRFRGDRVRRRAGDREAARAARTSRCRSTLHWTWEYGSEVEELRALYEKGKVNQWNAERDLDWTTPVTNDEWVLNPEASMLAQLCKLMGKDEATQKAAAFDELAHMLSQLLHGEQAALQLCGQLTNVCTKMDEKWYAASQVIDEARHVEAFSKFLTRKLGTIYPIDPTLKIAARRAARGRHRAQEDARHADPLRGHGGRHHRPAARASRATRCSPR